MKLWIKHSLYTPTQSCEEVYFSKTRKNICVGSVVALTLFETRQTLARIRSCRIKKMSGWIKGLRWCTEVTFSPAGGLPHYRQINFTTPQCSQAVSFMRFTNEGKGQNVREHCSTHIICLRRDACWVLGVIFLPFAALASKTGSVPRPCPL